MVNIQYCVHRQKSKSVHPTQIRQSWPKARHHKRRIVQNDFVSLVRDKLQSSGTLHMATDWEEYAQHMLQVMEAAEGFINIAGLQNFALRPSTRALTKFEQRGHRLGYGVWDLIFQKR